MRSSHNHPNQSIGVYGFILLIFIFCLMLIIHQDANASHMLGAELTYKHVSGKKYLVNYTLYRDCSGISAPANMNLKVQSESCSSTSFYSLELDINSGKEIGKLCPSALTTCQGGSFSGVQAWNYSCEIDIPANCPDWKLSVTDCCRSSSITTISEPSSSNIFLEAFLNNTYGSNNSVTFLNSPENQILLGQDQIIQAAAKDEDGDSLVYLLAAPQASSDQTVNFLAPYRANNPFGSEMSLDVHTGEIHINPTQMLTGIFSVQVLEYRNGIHIGTISRDMQVSVQASSNLLPVLSGINGTSVKSISACTGTALSFSIFSNDLNSNQQLKVSWETNIPNAQISTSNGLHPVTNFSWTPTSADAIQEAYVLTLTVQDDACPYYAAQTYSYSINVNDMKMQTESIHVSCPGGSDGSISTLVSGGIQPYSFNWTDSDVDASQRDNLSAGTYSVHIIDAAGCSLNQEFEISTQFSNPVVSLSGTIAGCAGHPLVLEAGSGQASYIWSDNSNNESLEVNAPGTYSVEVTNSYGCKSTGSIEVIFQVCSGIEREEMPAPTLSFYPNPVKDKVSIKIETSSTSGILFTISDMQGKVVATYQEGNEPGFDHVLDMSQLAPGIYFLLASTGTELQSVKFCKL